MKGQKPFIQLENKKVLLSLVREVQKLADALYLMSTTLSRSQ